jgi:hypothetical protein
VYSVDEDNPNIAIAIFQGSITWVPDGGVERERTKGPKMSKSNRVNHPSFIMMIMIIIIMIMMTILLMNFMIIMMIGQYEDYDGYCYDFGYSCGDWASGNIELSERSGETIPCGGYTS